MGGRREVIYAPVTEVLQYMDMELTHDEQQANQKQAEMWINYISMVLSQPEEGQPDPERRKAREELQRILMPKNEEAPSKKLLWDFEQEGG